MKTFALFCRPLAGASFLTTVALGLLLHASLPAVAGTDGFHPTKTAGGVSAYQLDANGLEVLLLEDHSAPVLTVMVTYRVGSRNEVTGTTGATHLLEHLMFKGSRNFNPGIGKGFDTVMDGVGSLSNASTALDSTNYYENLPSDHLELALQIEADRMRGLLLREEDRRPEMTVVRNEFERGENDPGAALDKEVGAAAYIAHPYHHPTIGWRSDIEKVTTQKLREFYDTFYWPDNAFVTIIGDFNPDNALALVKKHFGRLTRAPKPIPQVTTEEPAQSGARRVIVKRPGETGAVEIAFKAPAATHPDHAALTVLAAILSDGKTSRLYRSLVDTNLAIDAEAANDFTHDNSLFYMAALLAPGTTQAEAEKALLAAVAKVRSGGVSAEEVSRAIAKLKASAAYLRDGSFALAGEINSAIAVGDWTLFVTDLDRLEAVTPADVNRVAGKYLVEDQSTTGWFIPETAAGASGSAKAAGTRAAAHRSAGTARGPHHYREPGNPEPGNEGSTLPRSKSSHLFGARESGSGNSGVALVAPHVHRRSVAGLDVLTLKTPVKDVVTIRGALSGGDVFNPPGNSAIADLTADMIDQGTTTHDKYAISEQLERVGASIEFGSGPFTVNFSAKCLRKDLPMVLGLLAEQLRTPRLDAHDFAKRKKQLVGERMHDLEDPDFRADDAFDRAIFPVGHPNHPPGNEKEIADLRAATLQQVKAFHATNYGPAIARVVAVGDIDDAAMDEALQKAFGGWKGGKPIPPVAKAPTLTTAVTEKISMPGRSSVSLVIGQPSGLRYSDPDYQALRLATAVFGSGFFSARLMNIVRNREGLTYSIGAALGGDTYADGSWQISATFAPELLEKGTASTLRELKRFATEGLTLKELDTFKITVTGSYKVTLSTTDGLAAALLNAIQRGYGPGWVDEYPRRVEAVTLAEANAAIRSVLHPDRMVTVVAGALPEGK